MKSTKCLLFRDPVVNKCTFDESFTSSLAFLILFLIIASYGMTIHVDNSYFMAVFKSQFALAVIHF